MHYDKRNVDAAIKDLTEAVRINPNSAEGFNARGFILRRKGDLDHVILGAIREKPSVRRALILRSSGMSPPCTMPNSM